MHLQGRASGILLHPTSLPGQYGIGDLGAGAYRFVDWLAEQGQSIWQALPLGPTSYGDSPYQTLSAFAGNCNLISLDRLVDDGLLSARDLADAPPFPAERVDYGWVIPFHDRMLAKAHRRFRDRPDTLLQAAFEQFVARNRYWLEDFALFIALKQAHQLRPWVEWEVKLRRRDPAALKWAAGEYAQNIDLEHFRQWLFHRQWSAIKAYANGRGIRLFGDLPIFVAHDSADVWARQDDYLLDTDGQPTAVAGVPPDYFSPTGQRWGNPLYRWDVMAADGYNWWLQRLRFLLRLVDSVRIDHFRGFEAYWRIPATEPTAVKGAWMPGPSHRFFKTILSELGELPIIAEDLGVITPGVEKLRDDFGLPGMKVLQFAWSDSANPFLPHNHKTNCIVYTGTHDNNTTRGWWESEVAAETRAFVEAYLGHEVHDIVWTLARVGMRSPARACILPMQDVLGLGESARMNKPGLPAGNWSWRIMDTDLDDPVKDKLRQMTRLYQRHPDQQTEFYGDAATGS
ncbi:MAG: 4-alpha-glucanotransferase [Chloroflexi bacterium]|nr:4-alpha-glucanotransferase [Chloroflexota bacterium]